MLENRIVVFKGYCTTCKAPIIAPTSVALPKGQRGTATGNALCTVCGKSLPVAAEL